MAYFNGNKDFIVLLSSGSGGSNVELDTTLTKEGCAAEAKATGLRIEDLEQQMADMNYKQITASLSVSPSTAEMGQSVTNAKLTWSTSKETSAITLDGVSVDGKTTHTDTNTYTANKTWTLKATEADEKGATATATAKLTFYNGVYYGAVAEPTEYNSAFILGLTKTLRSSKLTSFTANAGEGQYIYYCLPKSMGTCSFKVGGFDGGFSLVATISFTNSTGNHTEDYYIYRTDNAALGSTSVAVS